MDDHTLLETTGSVSPVAPASPDLIPDPESANEPPAIDLSQVLMIDERILHADSHPESDFARQMAEALTSLEAEDWLLMDCVEDAA